MNIDDHGAAVTDHWHAVAVAAHWLSYAVYDSTDPESRSTDLWLARVETSDVIAAIAAGTDVDLADAVLVYTTRDAAAVAAAYPSYTGTAIYEDTVGEYATNDHFIAAVEGNIAVVLWRNDGSGELLVVTVDTSASPLSGTYVSFLAASSGLGTGSTMGSAARLGLDSWGVMAADSVSPVTGSPGEYTTNTITLWATDSAFDDAVTTDAGTLSDASYHLQMASFLQLAGNGDVVVAYKRLPVYTSPYYDDGTAFVADWGDIVLEIRDSTLVTSVYSEVIHTASSDTSIPGTGGNRPHVSRYGQWLVTCWDVAQLDPAATDPATNQVSHIRFDLLDAS